MTIKGIVVQIIPPEKQHDYCLPWSKLEDFIDGKYLVVIKPNTEPKSTTGIKLKNIYEKIFSRRKIYPIVMSQCSYKVGDQIETTIEDIYIKSGYYTTEGYP